MEFLKNAALPQPMEHVHLLLFMMNLVFILLIPYLGFLLGTSILSYVYNKRGRNRGDRVALHLSKILIDIGAGSKEVLAFLAVIPSLTLVLLLSELLQGTSAIAPGLMAFGFLLLSAGATLLYTYRFTLRLSGILKLYGESLRREQGRQTSEQEDLSLYEARTEKTHLRAGILGIVFTALASFLTIGAIYIAGDPDAWSGVANIFDLLFSVNFLLRYLEFLIMGAAATGVGILFFLFSWQGGMKEVEKPVQELAQALGIRMASLSIVLQPFVLLGTVLGLPASALSGSVFVLSGFVLVLFFGAAHFLYAFRREPGPGYAAYAFYALALAAIALVTRDQLAVSNTTRTHSIQLAVAAEQNVEEMKARLGFVVVKTMSGQEIYDTRCSACHLFDTRKIGPAYKDVVPKYAGRKAQMMAFVMNPVKVDPGFPSMPNQGLKPAEADSIVSYLLSKFGTKPPATESKAK